MSLFRYFTEKDDKYIELNYEGNNYKKSLISLCVTQKNAAGKFVKLEDLLPPITYDKEKAKIGYSFKSKFGNIVVKWITHFWIISEIQVLIDDYKLSGGEILNIKGVETGHYV
ncbi:MAG: hypothetical protein WCX95_03470 [Candidatus Gracilibacteria bacterium]